jgi:hypothetical protein
MTFHLHQVEVVEEVFQLRIRSHTPDRLPVPVRQVLLGKEMLVDRVYLVGKGYIQVPITVTAVAVALEQLEVMVLRH